MKTFSPTPKDINREWFVVDAQDQVLGRLASQIAHRLRGKHKPEFAPHMDNGDFIVVVNCEKIKVTGNKLADKKYYRHSGWVGGARHAAQESSGPRHAEETEDLRRDRTSAYGPESPAADAAALRSKEP